MYFSRLEQSVEEVAKDKQSGAVTLASKSIDIYIQYLENVETLDKTDFLNALLKLSTLLQNAQPSMTSISNVVDFVLNHIIQSEDASLSDVKQLLLSSLQTLKNSLITAKTKIAQNALSCIPDNSVIITLSESSTVEEVIKCAHAAGKVSRVIIAESRPLLEGLNLADRLLKFGVPVTIIVDAAIGFFCKDADIAVVGADTVQRDASVVHKIGTYPLALACYDHNKPFYIVCDSLKFSKIASYENPVKICVNTPTEILDKNNLNGADIQNIYFDITPAKYITRIITEKGIFPPIRKALFDL